MLLECFLPGQGSCWFCYIIDVGCMHFVRHIFNFNQNLDVHIQFMRNRFQASYNSFLVAQILLCWEMWGFRYNSMYSVDRDGMVVDCGSILCRLKTLLSSYFSFMYYPILLFSLLLSLRFCGPEILYSILRPHSTSHPPSAHTYPGLPGKALLQASSQNSCSTEDFLDFISKDNASFTFRYCAIHLFFLFHCWNGLNG